MKLSQTKAKKVFPKFSSKVFLRPRKNYFDSSPIYVLNAISTDKGILLPYFVKKPLSIGVALFDKKNRSKPLWRSANPIWKTKEKLEPIKAEMQDENLVIYFGKEKKNRQKIIIPFVAIFGNQKTYPVVLERALNNPIINPKYKNPWESKAAFNAAAIYLGGKIHLLYRAIGDEGISVLGYAASKEGIRIDERLDYPIYLPREPYELRKNGSATIICKFMSGGGYGGCEDPRLTKLGNKLYMTYTTFNGSNPPAVALTSIKVKDFLEKKWKWKKPILISTLGEIHKNWTIFPEKINGKHAILHSISPEVQIEYVDTLDFNDMAPIKSFHSFSSRENCWDCMIRGVGPPPIKTEAGWLIIYHAMDNKDPNRYKLGALILDKNNPIKIIYRSQYPILEPDAEYENNGFKAGVVYACGATVINGRLLIYYGGADTVTCVATLSLNQLLNKLKASKPIRLEYV